MAYQHLGTKKSGSGDRDGALNPTHLPEQIRGEGRFEYKQSVITAPGKVTRLLGPPLEFVLGMQRPVSRPRFLVPEIHETHN